MPPLPPALLEVELELGLGWRSMPDDAPETHDDPEASRALIVTLQGIDALLARDGSDEARRLARIEAKLDLVLLLLAGSQQRKAAGTGEGSTAAIGTVTSMPDLGQALQPTMARLSPTEISWRTRAAPVLHAPIWIDLLLEPDAPLPAILPARVTALEVSQPPTPAADLPPEVMQAAGVRPEGSPDAEIQVTARFIHLSDEARDALAARVFRLHRRAIHALRGAP